MGSFDDFDPLHGKVPGYPFFELSHIAWEARKLVEGLSKEDIFEIEQAVDDSVYEMRYLYVMADVEEQVHRVIEQNSWELEHHPKDVPTTPESVRHLLENWPASVDEQPDLAVEDDLSEVEALRFAIDIGDLRLVKTLVNEQPVRCAAILALAFVSRSISTLECPEDELGTDEKGPVAARLISAANDAIEAARALGLAKEMERLSDLQQEQEKIRSSLSELFSQERARTAAQKRHRAMAEAKQFVQSEWCIHAHAYQFNKTDFARTYVDLVRNRFNTQRGDPLSVTIKTVAEVWLKNTPPTGK